MSPQETLLQTGNVQAIPGGAEPAASPQPLRDLSSNDPSRREPASGAPANPEPPDPEPANPEPSDPGSFPGVSLQQLLQPPAWLQLEFNLDAQPLANPAGGSTSSGSWMQQLSLDAHLSSGLAKPAERWREGDHWRGHLQLMLFSGDADWAEQIGAAFPLQSAAHPTGLWLTEASIERHPGPDGAVGVKAGLFSLNPDFIEAPVLNAYVHSALNNTLNLNVAGLPINPYAAPGLRLSWTPRRDGGWGTWRYGAFWLDSQTNVAALLGVTPDAAPVRGSTQLLQWSYGQLPGQGWVHGPLQAPGRSPDQPLPRLLPPPLLQITGGVLTNSGLGRTSGAIAGTLTLAAPLPLGLDNRLWLGASVADEDASNPVPLFLSGGWLNQGLIPGRPMDVLALGFGCSRFNGSVTPRRSSESVLELNYALQLGDQLSLQPVLQWIINPGGQGEWPDIVALGLQLQLQF